ncbi:type II secretion system F family protein [bacterium]|nr:type II secretion system F family protein [bacterium]
MVQKGRVEAANINKAAETLSERGLFVITLDPVVETGFLSIFARKATMKFDEVVIFTRQMAAIIEAGLTITNGIGILADQASPGAKEVLNQILNDLEAGMSFSAALRRFPKIFDNSYTYMVEAGESSGSLDVVLNRLADTMEERREFKSKVSGAMIYPIAIFIIMGIVVVVVMIFVVPTISEIFEQFDAELPIATRILIGLSDFMVNYWYWCIALVAAVVGVYWVWYQAPASKRIVDKIMLKIPVFGPLRQKTILKDYNETLGMLVHSGVPLVEALDLAGSSVTSPVYHDNLMEIQEKVEKGISLGTAFEAYDDFPPIMTQMIKVGEETGKLDEVLMKITEYFRGDSERAVANMMSALEPIIMVILGLAVAFLVIAIILPIFQLSDAVNM